MIINFYSDINLIVKLIKKTNIFKIHLGFDNLKSSKFIDLFTKCSAFINIQIPFKNYKIYTKKIKIKIKIKLIYLKVIKMLIQKKIIKS